MIKTKKKITAALCAVLVSASCLSPAAAAVDELSAERTFNAGSVGITASAFPDDTFRQYVSDNFDTNGDGILSADEISNVTQIDVSGTKTEPGSITDLGGVGYFTNLEILYCKYNKLTGLDVSKNTALKWLLCGGNQISRLDSEYNTDLEILYCENNDITALNLRKNTALKKLACSGNDIEVLDVSYNTNLLELWCEVIDITSLDVSNNPKLEQLICGGNDITELDVSRCPNLTQISCGSCKLTSLDVSKNTALKYLHCENNKLTSLDLSNNTALEKLSCNKNQLTSLDLSYNSKLNYLRADDNVYNIGEVKDSYSLDKLPKGFDPDKASEWTGATYDKATNSLINFTADKVTYKYNCGNVYSRIFTLECTPSSTPGAPKNPVISSVVAGENNAVVRWNAINGISTYRVYYRIKGTSKWSYRNTNVTAMNVTGLTSGKTYEFLVRAYNGSLWSVFTDENIVTAATKAPEAKPVFSSLTPGVNSVVLRWNAVDGAKSYRVFYRINGTSKWTYRNTTVTAMNLTGLTGGKKYDFLVRSYNGSAWSTYTSADIKTATPKAASKPNITSVTPGKNSVTVKWTAVDGASSYRVFYRVKGTAKWASVNTTRTQTTLTGLTGGKTYEILVRSNNPDGWSSYSPKDYAEAEING